MPMSTPWSVLQMVFFKHPMCNILLEKLLFQVLTRALLSPQHPLNPTSYIYPCNKFSEVLLFYSEPYFWAPINRTLAPYLPCQREIYWFSFSLELLLILSFIGWYYGIYNTKAVGQVKVERQYKMRSKECALRINLIEKQVCVKFDGSIIKW